MDNAHAVRIRSNVTALRNHRIESGVGFRNRVYALDDSLPRDTEPTIEPPAPKTCDHCKQEITDAHV